MSNMQYSRKPGNYWKDFSHVEKELLAFIAEYGTPGVMPIKAELLKAGRGDLAKAIIKTHGSIEVVAERLGLQLPSYKRKRRGYWEDFANVTSELQNFIAERGMPGVMPTQDDLTKAGLTSLTNAIDHHGASFTPEGIIHFIRDLQQFGFEQVGSVREIRSEDGIVLKGIHFTLTGDVGKPEETVFERK